MVFYYCKPCSHRQSRTFILFYSKSCRWKRKKNAFKSWYQPVNRQEPDSQVALPSGSWGSISKKKKKLPYAAISPYLHTSLSVAMIRRRHWLLFSEAGGYINGHRPFCSHPGSDQKNCENTMSTWLPCFHLTLHLALVCYLLVSGMSTLVLLIQSSP